MTNINVASISSVFVGLLNHYSTYNHRGITTWRSYRDSSGEVLLGGVGDGWLKLTWRQLGKDCSTLPRSELYERAGDSP